MLVAITREVSPAIERCELTHFDPATIDFKLAGEQHRRYEEFLACLGCEVKSLPAEPDLPDSVFVEDAAVVLDELAVITRPGAKSRRGETESIAAALGRYRNLIRIVGPGTVDGGDVLVVERDVYIGLSSRTNAEGIRQIETSLEPLGYTVTPVRVGSCLHLKSAVGRVAPDTLLINRNWVDAASFRNVRMIDVDPGEPRAANALPIGDTVIYPARFVRTLERLHENGIRTQTIDYSELAKAEAGVTCCSLVFERNPSS